MLDPSDSTHANGATNVVISSNRPSGYPGNGIYSLVVPVNITGAGSWEAGVGTVFCKNNTTVLGGYRVTGYVYFDGPAFPTYTVLALYTWAGTDDSSNYQLILMSQTGTSIEPKKWLPIDRTINSSLAADRLAMVLAPNGQPWTGTIYFDDIKVMGL